MSLQRVVTALGLLLLSIVASTAYAHKVNVFAYVEGDQVYIQGYFSDGNKAKNSDVTVYASDGKELTKGKTDEDGAFTFPTQGKQQALHVVLNAGMGHQAAYDIPMDEMAGATMMATGTAASSASQDPVPRADEPHADGDSAAPAKISEAAIRRAVAEGVLPLAREISELKERRGFSDIVGGIGFIVGVLGIYSYLKARQETRRVNKGNG
jgi:nickel transport protein